MLGLIVAFAVAQIVAAAVGAPEYNYCPTVVVAYDVAGSHDSTAPARLFPEEDEIRG